MAFCGLVVGPTGLLGMRILPVKKGMDDNFGRHTEGKRVCNADDGRPVIAKELKK